MVSFCSLTNISLNICDYLSRRNNIVSYLKLNYTTNYNNSSKRRYNSIISLPFVLCSEGVTWGFPGGFLGVSWGLGGVHLSKPSTNPQ